MSIHQFSEIRIPISANNPSIMRDEALCIKCGACRHVCETDVAVGRLYDLESTDDCPICIHCGQCANVCPQNSITEQYEYHEVKKAILDPDKIVVFNTSPSVRVSLGEEFGLEAGTFVEGKMVAALRALGADYVLDTNFSADLTIMEEASELAERILGKAKPLPQFTSCCPAWIKFVETFYPNLLPHISSAKSPIGMQGPTVKTYFARENGIDPRQIVNVAVTPCTAKKFEIRRTEMCAASKELDIPDMRDMDHVITTRELAKWLKEKGIDFGTLQDSDYDLLMGAASGAGVIFGNTGGVMEAAARAAHYFVTGENPSGDYLNLHTIRGMDSIRGAKINVGKMPVRVAVVHGMSNARQILKSVVAGKCNYDFIEVMNCRGGCIGGGGQPKTVVPMSDNIRKSRIAALYKKDSSMSLRFSHENPDIKAVYKRYYGKPLSPLAERLLHTSYHDRSDDLGLKGVVEKPHPSAAIQRCGVCGYEHTGDMPENFFCPVCKVPKENFKFVPGHHSATNSWV